VSASIGRSTAFTVEVGFSSNPTVAVGSTSWTDVTSDVRSFDTDRGKSHQADRFEAGTATVVLNNRSRNYDPANASGAYYPNVQPMRRLRIGAGYLPMVRADGPTAYWRLGEASGTTATDELGAFNATYQNTPTLGVAGRISGNTAVTFDSSQSEHATAGDISAFDTGDCTYECWFKTSTTSGDRYMVSEGSSASNNDQCRMGVHNTVLTADLFKSSGSDFTTINGTTNCADGNWHHAVLVKSGTNFTLYLDGHQEAQDTTIPTTGLVADRATIGAARAASTSSYWNGTLDEPAIYKRALSAAEILQHYTEGALGVTDGYLFTGFIDSWKQSYPAIGPTSSTGDAICTVTATDGFKVLALAKIVSNIYRDAVLADTPRAYYRLGEKPKSGGVVATAADSSGNGFTGTVLDASTNHTSQIGGTSTGAPAFGAASPLLADPDTACDFSNGTVDNDAGVIDCGTGHGLTGTTSFSVEFWAKIPTATATTQFYVYLRDNTGATNNGFVVESDIPFLNITAGSTLNPSGTLSIKDGRWHHVVFVYNQSALTGQTYIDGVNVDDRAVSSFTFPTTSRISIGGDARPGTLNYQCACALDEVAIYNTALTAARVLAHYNAGTQFQSAQLSSARVTAVLDTISWPSADRNIDTGQSTLVAVTETLADTAALTHLQDVELSENGALFMQGDGKVRFRARHTILTATASTTSQATFGDSGSELPYADIELDDTDDLVRNQVLVTPSGGAAQLAEDATSQASFLKRTYSRDILVGSAAEANDAANWILSHFKDAQERVSAITIKPLRSTTLAIQAVARLIDDRVTVNRRPPGGGTKTAAVLVEGVAHRVDFSRTEWTTTFQLSLAEVDTYLILDDATYGKLNTGKLAY
jgi:hypothetical protein